MAASWVSGKDRTKGPGAAVDRILSSSFDGVARREGRHDSNQTSTSAPGRQIARPRSRTKLRRPRRSHFLDRSPRLNPAGFSPDGSRQPGSRLGPVRSLSELLAPDRPPGSPPFPFTRDHILLRWAATSRAMTS